MQQWEYLEAVLVYWVEQRENYEVLWWRSSAQDTEVQHSLDQVLNGFGTDGWELVLLIPIGPSGTPRYRAVFKRLAALT